MTITREELEEWKALCEAKPVLAHRCGEERNDAGWCQACHDDEMALDQKLARTARTVLPRLIESYKDQAHEIAYLTKTRTAALEVARDYVPTLAALRAENESLRATVESKRGTPEAMASLWELVEVVELACGNKAGRVHSSISGILRATIDELKRQLEVEYAAQFARENAQVNALQAQVEWLRTCHDPLCSMLESNSKESCDCGAGFTGHEAVNAVLVRDAAIARAETAVRDLKNLLAIIHRDGGHHTGDVGVSQSVADAHASWAHLVSERNEAWALLWAAVAFHKGRTHDDGCPALDCNRDDLCDCEFGKWRIRVTAALESV